MTKPMTKPMEKAIEIAKCNGAVFAGKNSNGRGGLVTVSVSTIRGLERRDLVVVSIGPDGGMMAKLCSK